jgi:glyoxylase-like metal-dependent hydrolase (beta-lactamase superfamily II)
MKRVMVLGLLLALGTLSVAVMGYQGQGAGRGGQREGRGGADGRGGAPAAPAALQSIKVRDNLYMITNGGGNTGVFIMANGVALVDTKNPNNGPGILAEVKKVTNKPVTLIINTHTHGDHTGSNEFFSDNVTFVAHENTKANMQKMPNFAGDKAKFLPSKTYKDKLALGAGADQIVLYYFGPAHTSGDSFVVFPAIRAMHAGDAFASKGTPIVDTMNGGSAVQYGQTLAKAYSKIKNVDTIINGHITTGPTTFADLKTYADFNNEFVTWVKAEIKAGKTADQAANEYKVPEKYAAMGYTAGNPALFGGAAGNVRTAYMELGAK